MFYSLGVNSKKYLGEWNPPPPHLHVLGLSEGKGRETLIGEGALI